MTSNAYISDQAEFAALFHAVIWTEAALRAQLPASLVQVLCKAPLWESDVGIRQIVLSTSRTPVRKDAELPNGATPTLIIGPWTSSAELETRDFDRYCSTTLSNGLEYMRVVPGVQEARLGVFGPPELSEAIDAATEAAAKLEPNSRFVEWTRYINDDGEVFYGPSLYQLAEKSLVRYGIDPDRALWICAMPSTSGDHQTLDGEIAAQAALQAPQASPDAPRTLCLNVGITPFPDERPWNDHLARRRTLVDLSSSATPVIDFDPSAVIAKLRFCSPISLHPRAAILLHKRDIIERLANHKKVAFDNLKRGEETVQRVIANCPSFIADASIISDGGVFDHRSGAISFDAYRWELQVAYDSKAPYDGVAKYFRELLEKPWQRERPNHRRILATPTQFLLRGEDYYTNLKNESPTTRLKEIIANTGAAFDHVQPELMNVRDEDEWKLLLALIDQLRNASLQLGWFENALGTGPFSIHQDVEFSAAVRRFIEHVGAAYYNVLFGRFDFEPLQTAKDEWSALRGRAERLVSAILKQIEDKTTERFELNFDTSRLIRRWREADHPGENALVALLAIESLGNDLPPSAVGIGWGGVELPLAFRHICRIIGKRPPSVFAAHYSKYARHGSREPQIVPISSDAVIERDLSEGAAFVFDDNSLSGATLQTVAEYLWSKHRVTPRHVFLTRFSGERRYDQMRMEKTKRGGVVDPALLKEDGFIRGYLGETPFSRSWSRDVYQNPIGVFSLAKRRILELLHSNSSADRFDREGF